MTLRQIRDLMEQIDCTEDPVQITRFGSQHPLLGLYASDRNRAVLLRRAGYIAMAQRSELRNDMRYAKTAVLVRGEDR